MTIRIVTDSTCDLPAQIIKELKIIVVPLYINIGEKGYRDGIDITRKEFYTNLPIYPSQPTTGTPSMDVFCKLYGELASAGADEILSIHISKCLSATVDVARLAAEKCQEFKVTVLDSRQLSLGTGFQVETAARMALEGKPMGEIMKELDDLARRSFVAARLDTLEFLKRSGRMSTTLSGIGSLLRIKPIMKMEDGNPTSERVRTTRRAEERLIQLLEERKPIERFALLHTNAAEEAQAFRKRIEHLIPAEGVYSMDITPVIGAHIGPGAVGYAVVTGR
jgi:DegV family protein with EDD domain